MGVGVGVGGLLWAVMGWDECVVPENLNSHLLNLSTAMWHPRKITMN